MNKEHLKIKDLPESERPYEKVEKYSASVLSDAELLSVLIRSGPRGKRSTEVALELLKCCDKKGGLSAISRLSLKELMELPGIGRVKAIELQCVAEISKRIAASDRIPHVQYDNPGTIAAYYMESMRHLEREQLKVVFLDNRNCFLHDTVITSGSSNQSIMDPRDVYREALLNNASRIVVLHNHPSGDPNPSSADISSTGRLEDAGMMLGLFLLDHIIIGDRTYFSFKENGFLKKR